MDVKQHQKLVTPYFQSQKGTNLISAQSRTRPQLLQSSSIVVANKMRQSVVSVVEKGLYKKMYISVKVDVKQHKKSQNLRGHQRASWLFARKIIKQRPSIHRFLQE